MTRYLLIMISLFMALPVWALDIGFSQPNEQGQVDVYVSSAPKVYGADVLVGYDPVFFEVIDSNSQRGGTQIIAGDFFPEGANLLDNRIDLRKGEIHFATALLRPMPEVSGDGVLMTLPLKAKKSGQTKLTLKKAEFGTTEGELYSAKPTEMVITATKGKLTAQADTSESAPIPMITWLLGAIVALLIVIVLLLLRKKS